MNRREFITGALAAGAAATLGLSGCGRSGSGKVSLRYNTHWTGRDAHGPTMDWLYAEFRKRRPDIDLKAVQIAGSLDSGQKLLAELVAGGGPDILHNVWWDLIRAGYAMDVTDFIKPRIDRFYPEALESCCWNGRYYGFPSEFSMTPCIWNTRLLEEIGKEAPSTVDEYMEVGDALRRKGIPLTSFSCGGAHIFNCVLFAQPHVPELMAAEEWRAEPFVKAFRFIKQLVDKKFIPSNEMELQFNNGAALFQDGRLGHYMNGAWTIRNELTREGVDPDVRNHVSFTPFPAIDGLRMLRAWVPTKAALNTTLKDNPAKLEAAFAFFDLFMSQTAAEKFVSVAHSPQGVKVDITEEAAGTLLYHHWHSRDTADKVFTIPNNPGNFETKCFLTAFPDASAALLEGGSLKQAVQVFDESMRL